MNLDHTPHPVIEDHYHIRELIAGQEKRVADRTRHREIEKQRDASLKDIAGFKDIELLDFYCPHCDLDFIARAKKQIDSWAPIAYYKTKHRCGTWCIRHITQRDKDPYFYRSKKVARQRAENYKETIQPFETGFNMLYGKR